MQIQSSVLNLVLPHSENDSSINKTIDTFKATLLFYVLYT